jgi:hypothetical protein
VLHLLYCRLMQSFVIRQEWVSGIPNSVDSILLEGVAMKQIPLLKLFLVGLCTITFSVYGFYLAVSLLPKHVVTQANTWLEAGVQELKLRQEPGTSSTAVRSLDLGERLRLLSEQDNWLEVQDEKGNQGWVYRPYVVSTPPGLQ